MSEELEQKAGEFTVSFTEQELRVQMAMNDAALKAIGGGAAEAFLVFNKKYSAALAPVEAK